MGISSLVINGWHKIYLVVSLDLGSKTKIFFMKSLASSGTLVFFCYLYVYWKVILAVLYLFVGHFDLVSLERRAPVETGVANDAC